jgi:hypothetical protein
VIAGVVARALALCAVVGSLVIGGAIAQDLGTTGDSATSVTVTPARQDVACPGPLVTPAGGTGTDPELGGAATGVTRASFLGGNLRDVGDGKASDAVVGAQVERVKGGDITGLAALTCTAPTTDQWIVAGATTVGASARLLLTNPSQSSVEATVVAFGELGELDSRKVAIGPDSQQEVLLEGVVVDVASLAVHVTATGTGVVAALQDSRLEGFQPAGTDWGTASAVGTSLAIPGVGTGGSPNQAATVRLVAPDGATVRLALSTPDGDAVWEGVASLALDPGVVVELPVPAVDVGTITISADAPVVASALVTRTRAATAGVEGDTAQELRWIPAQLAADANERATVAVGYDETVVAFATNAGAFTLTDADGATVATATVTAGGTAVVPLDVPPGTVLTASGGFAWTVLVGNGDYLTALTPTRTTIDDLDIEVQQVRYAPVP